MKYYLPYCLPLTEACAILYYRCTTDVLRRDRGRGKMSLVCKVFTTWFFSEVWILDTTISYQIIVKNLHPIFTFPRLHIEVSQILYIWATTKNCHSPTCSYVVVHASARHVSWIKCTGCVCDDILLCDVFSVVEAIP